MSINLIFFDVLKNKFNNQLTIINDDVLKIDETKLFKDKVIVEVGAGPRGSILYTKGNFKRGIIIEPLIDRWQQILEKIMKTLVLKL